MLQKHSQLTFADHTFMGTITIPVLYIPTDSFRLYYITLHMNLYANFETTFHINRGNWKTRKHGNGNRNENGNNLKDVENMSQPHGPILSESLR